ncbi:MAG TPA: hypothetical protein VHM90_19725, partial [Phycisphaerae bacterium]|nr:hypothetical protein [Phycisphaerae bacterium]
GWLVLMPVAAIGATLLYVSAAHVNMIRYEPYFMLRRDFEHAAPAGSDAALAEICRRMDAGALKEADLSPLVEEILGWQADPGHGWELRWGNLIEECAARSMVSKGQWERYLAHAVGVRFLTNAKLHQGTNADVAVQVQSLRFDSSVHPRGVPLMHLDVDWKMDIEGSVRADTADFDVRFDDSRQKFVENWYMFGAPSRAGGKILADGVHQAKVEYTLRFRYIDGTAGTVQGAQPVGFEVLPPNVPLVEVRRDAAAIAAMQKALWFSGEGAPAAGRAGEIPSIPVPARDLPAGVAPTDARDVVMHQAAPPFRGLFTTELVQEGVRWPFRNSVSMAVGMSQSSGLSLDREHVPAQLPHAGGAEIVMIPEPGSLDPHSTYPADGPAAPVETFGAELRFPVNLVAR